MKTKTPKPVIYDNVERVDYSKTDGYIKEILSNTQVLVSWFNGYDNEGMEKKDRIETIEVITDLALTRRI